jgi:hypothetical protein
MIRVGAHLTIGLVFGFLYRGVGSKADSVFANYVYLYGTTLFLVYTGKMAVTLSCKLQVALSVLLREGYHHAFFHVLKNEINL